MCVLEFYYQNSSQENWKLALRKLQNTTEVLYASHLLKTIKRTSALSKFITMQKRVSLRSSFVSNTINFFFNLAALKKRDLIYQTKDCLLINPVKLNECN